MTRNEPNLMAQIPDMFHAQKECCFRAMEQDAFPRSLRSKAFGNLTPALVRLVVGLIVLWIGLAVGFLRCAAEIETLFLIYTILNRCLPHFTNTNWTPSSSSLANPKQHLSVPCAIRQKATIRTGHPGLYARYRKASRIFVEDCRLQRPGRPGPFANNPSSPDAAPASS